MTILVNGQSTPLVPNLEFLLVQLGYQQSVVATALNGKFIARDQRSTTALADGDRVEIVAPMQGG